MLEQELGEFGKRMGLPGLAFGPNGLAALDVERMGRLHLEKNVRAGATELLLYLACPCQPHDREAAERALERCHYRHADPFPLCASRHNDQVILLIRLPERDVTAAAIEKAALFLADVMRAITGEA